MFLEKADISQEHVTSIFRLSGGALEDESYVSLKCQASFDLYIITPQKTVQKKTSVAFNP
jgi:hypothetical protein